MLHKLIATLRKRGAQGRTFPVQATEATQAAELIAGVVAQRDELLAQLEHTCAWMSVFLRQFNVDATGVVLEVTRKDTGATVEINLLSTLGAAIAAIDKANGIEVGIPASEIESAEQRPNHWWQPMNSAEGREG